MAGIYGYGNTVDRPTYVMPANSSLFSPKGLEYACIQEVAVGRASFGTTKQISWIREHVRSLMPFWCSFFHTPSNSQPRVKSSIDALYKYSRQRRTLLWARSTVCVCTVVASIVVFTRARELEQTRCPDAKPANLISITQHYVLYHLGVDRVRETTAVPVADGSFYI